MPKAQAELVKSVNGSAGAQDAAALFCEAFESIRAKGKSGSANGTPAFTIAQLVRMFGISARALRFYEEKRLLSPQRQQGARLYGPEDIKRLKLILMGKRVGFSLADIQQVLSLHDRDPSPSELLSFVMRKLNEQAEFLEEQEAEIKMAHSELRHARAVVSGMLSKGVSAPESARRRGTLSRGVKSAAAGNIKAPRQRSSR